MSYDRYHWKIRELLLCIGMYLGISIGVAYLFYNSILGIAAALVILPAGFRISKKSLMAKQRQELTIQFKDCMRFVSGALSAGYSMENAWREAEKDMEKMHGGDTKMYRELHDMNTRIALNETVEKLLLDFAWRSGIEDVRDFAQVFAFAKRGGGDFVQIIGSTVKKISDKAEVMQEIETAMAAKKLEQKLMNIIPLLLLLYIRISSPDFISPLYGNALGVAIMSGCLLLYGAAILLSEKIIAIEV